MNKILRNVLVAGGSFAVVLGAAAVALPYLVPMDAYRGRIESAAATATGRAMKIDGPVKLTAFPHLGLKAQEVTLANVPGGKASVMVAVGDIDLSLQLLPLFQGKIALDKITLVKPTIALEVDPEGNENWKFGKESPKTEKKGTLTLPSGTAFNGITITDGMVTYDNAKTKTHRAVEHVNLTVDITTIDAPVTLKGDLAINAKKISFEGRLATLKTFLGSGTTQFGLSLNSELAKAEFNGQMTPDGTTDGKFRLDSPSLRDLSGWLGQKLPAGGLGSLSLSSRIVAKEKLTRLENLTVSLDGQHMTGTLSIDAAPKLPVLNGALAVDHLNLNPYLGGGKARGPAKTAQGWSREPISFALMKEFNGKLAFAAGSLTAQALHLGRTQLVLSFDNGLMHAVLEQISLYGGNGQSDTTVDVRGRVPQFTSHLRFSGVALKPLLSDMLALDAIEGNGAVTLDIGFAGDTPNAILHSLSGKGAITGTNGRVKGVDLGKVARTVSVILGGDATGEVAGTDFHEMGASFSLAQGVLTTSDFHLAGPVVAVTGQGGIDIGGRSIDFRVRPGAAVGAMSFGVPFRITGSWDKLHYAPDVAALVGGAIDNLRSGASALTGLFGGSNNKDSGPKNGEKPGDKKDKKNTGDKLKDIFGFH